MFSYKWIKGALSRLSWSFFTSAPISVKVALVKPWSMLHSQMFPKHIKYSTKKKWTLKTCQPNKFSINTISIRFSLLQVCPPVPYFLCALLFIPSFNVFSGYFYAFCNLVAVPTVWISIRFGTPLRRFNYNSIPWNNFLSWFYHEE